jgi:hypothetical protein
MSLRALVVALAALLVTAAAWGCGSRDRGGDTRSRDVARSDRPVAPQDDADAPSANRPEHCPVTPPNHRIPPGQSANPGASKAPYHGNGRLWTVLPSNGIVRDGPERDGSVREKFPWWRGPGVRGRLRIAGRRLDAPGPPLRAAIPVGYGLTDFQASEIIFPRAGCWSVTGTAGRASLSFHHACCRGRWVLAVAQSTRGMSTRIPREGTQKPAIASAAH